MNVTIILAPFAIALDWPSIATCYGIINPLQLPQIMSADLWLKVIVAGVCGSVPCHCFAILAGTTITLPRISIRFVIKKCVCRIKVSTKHLI